MKFLAALVLCIGLASLAHAQNWPSFRGRNGAGVSDGNAQSQAKKAKPDAGCNSDCADGYAHDDAGSIGRARAADGSVAPDSDTVARELFGELVTRR